MSFGRLGFLGGGFTHLGSLGGVNNPAIILSNSSIAETAFAGDPVGTLSVVNATGTPVFSLTDSAGNRFAIDGDTLERGVTALDYETATSHSITVSVSGMTPAPADRTFTIQVTDIAEGTSALMRWNAPGNSQYIAAISAI